MPLKDKEARKKYAHQQYLKNKEIYIERSRARRLRLQAEKALLPKQEKPKPPCYVCGSNRSETDFPAKGNKCKRCVSEYNKKYRECNSKRIAKQKKLWSEQNKAHKAALDREYARKNPEARKAARAKWDANNPGKTNAAKVKNKTERLMRVPSWLTEDDHWMIAQAYELAAVRTKLFGFKWHVDHIVPLKGKIVSGLHVPWNLQVIPAVENIRKGNRLEMPYV